MRKAGSREGGAGSREQGGSREGAGREHRGRKLTLEKQGTASTVRKAARLGLVDADIARLLGVSPRQFMAWVKQGEAEQGTGTVYSRFVATLRRERATGIARVLEDLAYQSRALGDPRASKLLLGLHPDYQPKPQVQSFTLTLETARNMSTAELQAIAEQGKPAALLPAPPVD